MASYNIKHEHIDGVNRNKPNGGEIILKITRKLGKIKKMQKKSITPNITVLFPLALTVRKALMWFNLMKTAALFQNCFSHSGTFFTVRKAVKW